MKEKKFILEELKKTPIIQIACQRVGIGRATFYRWKKEDAEFANQAESAIQEGGLFINDMAESQLISAIKEKNMTGIIFWLKNHHPTYKTKVEISAGKKEDVELTEEQTKTIENALGVINKQDIHE